MPKIVLSLVLALQLIGCSSHSNDLKTDVGTMAEGNRLLDDEFYEEARKQFQRIKTEFPSSSLQVEADLKIADTYYNEESYQTAAQSYEEFLKTYPGRPEFPDALYKMGMCYVKQMPNTPQRDTRASGKVIDTFTRLMLDFPNNKYSSEAQQYIDRARNQLATKVYEIARFYERMGDFDAAARRYAELVEQYADHKLLEEAMAREVRCRRKAGQKDRADGLAKAFQEKFPQSEFMSMISP